MATIKSLGAQYSDSIRLLLDQLPQASFWEDSIHYQWEGFWYALRFLEAAIAIRAHFEARSDDVILASSPKTGTTWLKALCHCITQQQTDTADDSESSDPLVKNHPHVNVQTLETNIYAGNPSPDLTGTDLRTLKILSCNVWFREDLEMHKRMNALGDLIQLYSPDLMCLQEVTPSIYDIFQQSSWWKVYSCSVSNEMSFMRPYFCMQFGMFWSPGGLMALCRTCFIHN